MRKRKTIRRDNRQLAADALYIRAFRQFEKAKYRSAFRLLLLGAKRKDQSSQVLLGYFYDTGRGVARDRKKAINWYLRAYRQGSRIAASNIATIYRDDNDAKQALRWFERAAQLRDADAYVEMAKIALKDSALAPKAAGYLKKATAASNTDITPDSRSEAKKLLSRLRRKAKGDR
jgi:TPR repeat protein